jgi:hypothetical protein
MNRNTNTATAFPSKQGSPSPRPKSSPPHRSRSRAVPTAKHPPLPQEPLKPSPKTKELRAVEDVRLDKIRRAKRLLQNAHYPSDEVIESVADLLARNLSRQRAVAARAGG